MILKPHPEYVDIDSPFTPLPKQGHLSEKTPEYAAAAPAFKAGTDALWTSSADWPALRQAAGDPEAGIPPGGPDRHRDVVTELLQFPARDGQLLELKVYKSPNVNANAVLMYRMHGGGWVVGRHEVDGTENVYAATNPGIVVVSVEYRLAPENPFPGPLNDSYDGLLWCKENAKTLGVDSEKIIISGGSAGANLTAALTLEARDKGISGIIAQVLSFPSVCHPKFFPRDKYEFGSYIQNHDDAILNIRMMESFLDAHVADATPDHRHSPLLAKSLEGLPPTLIQCGGADILRDDAFAYSGALTAAGVDVEFYCYAGVPHCFASVLLTLPETALFYKRYMAFLKKCTDRVRS